MMRGILFVDFGKTDATTRDAVGLGLSSVLPTTIINFFTSELDQLAIVSRHRIVLLPTYLIVDDKNKVKLRYVGTPSPEYVGSALELINEAS